MSHRYRMSGPLWEKIKPLARQQRHEPTPAENRLWQCLRNRQIAGVKFRRQAAIERFIVDFYAARAWLIIEVDGPYHNFTGAQDHVRQEFLESMGLTVLRFSNEDVMTNLEGVTDWIAEHINSADHGGVDGAGSAGV